MHYPRDMIAHAMAFFNTSHGALAGTRNKIYLTMFNTVFVSYIGNRHLFSQQKVPHWPTVED